MGLGDVVDEFLNQDSLSDTCTSDETNFTATSEHRAEGDVIPRGWFFLA
jgi:hypothetical protein